MNLVFSFDEGYAEVFKVLLRSLYLNNKETHFNIYLLHDEMSEDTLVDLQNHIEYYKYNFFPIDCREYLEQSENFRINRYYTIEMYLWLFAPYLLPKEVDRALYLDADIVNMNSIEDFYFQDFEDHLFVAMDYKIKNQIIQPFNNLRLRTIAADNYFNTGIVLMNIQKLREERTPKEISEAVVDNKAILILPDQDVFNYLYYNEVKENKMTLETQLVYKSSAAENNILFVKTPSDQTIAMLVDENAEILLGDVTGKSMGDL